MVEMKEVGLAEFHIAVIEADFPHVTKRLRLLWGSPECERYLLGLVVPDREGRQGFPPHVFKSVLALSNLHHAPEREAPSRPDPWAGEFGR